MPIARKRTDETHAAVLAKSWLHDCEIATYTGRTMLRVDATINGRRINTYVSCETGNIDRTLSLDMAGTDPVQADRIDADLATVEAIPHVEDIELTVHERGIWPSISLMLPGTGMVKVEITADGDITARLARIARERRQDAEGNNLSRLGAMTLAIAARDMEELDRIVDTVMIGTAGVYRGIRFETNSQGRITTALDHQGVQMRSDGIEVADLPETVRAAITGRQRRHLEQVVDVPGFRDMQIVSINGSAMSNLRSQTRSRKWMRLDVRDAHGARFEQIEMEEVRTIAHETYARRNS